MAETAGNGLFVTSAMTSLRQADYGWRDTVLAHFSFPPFPPFPCQISFALLPSPRLDMPPEISYNQPTAS